MSAIRPGLPQIVPQLADAGRARSAQTAAFFRAAIDQAQSAPAASVPAASAPAVVTTRATSAPAPDPSRPPRPGSLLDIRI